MARGWRDEGEFLYTQEGYYKYPTIGDVMYNPELEEGFKWIEWNGHTWESMMNQPKGVEFDFTKYMIKNKMAFEAGTPTHVSILLGANEFGLGKKIYYIDTFINQLNQMIDSIHEFDSNIKVIVCLPVLGPDPQPVTSWMRNVYIDYNYCIKYASYHLIQAFDTDEALKRNIYLAPMTLTVDTRNGFNYVQRVEEVDGIKSLVINSDNSIHPNNHIGQVQMGNTLAAVIQKYR